MVVYVKKNVKKNESNLKLNSINLIKIENIKRKYTCEKISQNLLYVRHISDTYSFIDTLFLAN